MKRMQESYTAKCDPAKKTIASALKSKASPVKSCLKIAYKGKTKEAQTDHKTA